MKGRRPAAWAADTAPAAATRATTASVPSALDDPAHHDAGEVRDRPGRRRHGVATDEILGAMTWGRAAEKPDRMKRFTEKTSRTTRRKPRPVTPRTISPATADMATTRASWLTTITRRRGQRSSSVPAKGPRML